MNFRYLAKVVSGLKSGSLTQCLRESAEKTGRSKFRLFFDVLWCTARYGAGFNDYIIFEFYNMNHKQRSTYMTRLKNKKFDEATNDPAAAAVFDDKSRFYEAFAPFLKRQFVNLSKASDEEIAAFFDGREYVIAKPNDGECGEGIEKIRTADFESASEFVRYVRNPEKDFGVLEEFIVQHHEMSRLYPDSVNCLRMATLYWNDTPYVLYAVLKTGNNGKFVDNLENGGFACHMDLATGDVIGPAHTNKRTLAEVHPATGVRFEGFHVPYVQEACELVKEAAKVIPSMRYIGWDVCITEDGPAIIEGNHYAAYDFPQLPDRSQHREGLLSLIRKTGYPI